MILNTFANYPPRKRIGILTILLAIIAIFAGSPLDRADKKVNLKELSLMSVDNIKKVKVADLADWLIKGRFDYRLIDIRTEDDFEKYRIPSSENISVAELLNSDLARNEKIVLYSDNEIASAQAWFLLKAENFKGVYILDGGLKSWQDQILFPNCTCGDNPNDDQKHNHEKLAEISNYFGGKLKSGLSNQVEESVKMPVIAPPAQITLNKAKGKKKREGC